MLQFFCLSCPAVNWFLELHSIRWATATADFALDKAIDPSKIHCAGRFFFPLKCINVSLQFFINAFLSLSVQCA